MKTVIKYVILEQNTKKKFIMYKMRKKMIAKVIIRVVL